MQHGVQRFDGGGAVERRPTAEHLEEHGAHRKEVGARVHFETARLLGRHVSRRSEQHAGQRERRGIEEPGVDRTSEAEIEQLDAVRREKDVRRLQIAVDDQPPVQRVERGKDGDGRRNRLGWRQRTFLQAIRQRLAFEQLHRQIGLAVVLTNLKELADMRVAHRGGRSRLAQQRGRASADPTPARSP